MVRRQLAQLAVGEQLTHQGAEIAIKRRTIAAVAVARLRKHEAAAFDVSLEALLLFGGERKRARAADEHDRRLKQIGRSDTKTLADLLALVVHDGPLERE